MAEHIVIREPRDLAPWIDHTILAPQATEAQVVQLCVEARTYGFRAVCVNPIFVGLVARQLEGSRVAVCSVVAFPFGATPSRNKVAEAAAAVEDGAHEIDMVMAIGALKEGRHATVRDDIAAVKRACGPALLKVIIETSFLTDDEKVSACRAVQEAGADFVKTSTGYGGGGATVPDVQLMRRTVGAEMGVKAAGGIRTYEAALSMIQAGATRIGASASVAIIGGGKHAPDA
jgi:deoxyribose-phosphate aldolase